MVDFISIQAREDGVQSNTIIRDQLLSRAFKQCVDLEHHCLKMESECMFTTLIRIWRMKHIIAQMVICWLFLKKEHCILPQKWEGLWSNNKRYASFKEELNSKFIWTMLVKSLLKSNWKMKIDWKEEDGFVKSIKDI